MKASIAHGRVGPGVLLVIAIACGRHSTEPQLALGEAVAEGDLDAAAAILGQGDVDIDWRCPESDGYTLLMMAGGTREESGLVEFLLEHGADPNVSAPSGRTALQVAAMNGRVGHVKSLIAAGALPLAKDGDGLTALDYARRNGHAEVVQVLTEAVGEAD